ncbi:hypothetical protein MHSWG343_04380 [Candidatus Mycoplasma haematohominis]|uniref:Uncharacterized protein n=1 Tax=Candidatus Mycoplasma haematohominis TaxID=1494318 RepID=A0A478FPT9_9MOLU|nr:hypothetical protein MHSWG343_04380 [Candidatus Mycoplasma haemohominis]
MALKFYIPVIGVGVFGVCTASLLAMKFLGLFSRSGEERRKFNLFLNNENAPKHQFIQSPQLATFGHNFKHHFVDAENETNDEWWKWSFQSRYLFFRSSEVNELSDYSELKALCKNTYSKQIDSAEVQDYNKKFLEGDVWFFCSVEGHAPVTLEDDLDVVDSCDEFEDDEVLPDLVVECTDENRNSKKALQFSVYADSLVSINENNHVFWENQSAGFFDLDNGLGSKATSDKAGFKDIFEKRKQDENLTGILKGRCAENYKKKLEELDEVGLKEVLMFCSIRGSYAVKSK